MRGKRLGWRVEVEVRWWARGRRGRVGRQERTVFVRGGGWRIGKGHGYAQEVMGHEKREGNEGMLGIAWKTIVWNKERNQRL